jgi:hypothetical protein
LSADRTKGKGSDNRDLDLPLYAKTGRVCWQRDGGRKKNISGFGECGHSCTAGSACGWPVSPKLGRRIGSFVLRLTAAYRDPSSIQSIFQSAQLTVASRVHSSSSSSANACLNPFALSQIRSLNLQKQHRGCQSCSDTGSGSRSNLIMKQARLWQWKIARLKKRHARLCMRA